MKSKRAVQAVAAISFAVLPGGCRRAGASKPAPTTQLPPPAVRVAHPTRATVTEYLEFTGTTEASGSVDIRARVAGFLDQVLFEAGALVHKGDLLFVIDPAPFEARLKSAQADLETARAKLDLAQYNHQRMSRLRSEGTAAEMELVQARSKWDVAKAAVKAAEAAVDQATIDLGYTHIRSPIDGRISRNLVDAGNLVGAGEYTLLANIVKDDPIYAYFSATETELLEYLQRHPEERLGAKPDQPTPFYLAVGEGRDFNHVGYADWSDNRVDPDTGTIRIRGVFPNTDHAMLPGLFARIRAPGRTRPDALLVPAEALAADAVGRFVFVVTDDDTVQKRHVTVGPEQDGSRVIDAGIGPDDWVVVAGIQRLRHGMPVTVVRRTDDAPAAPGGLQPVTRTDRDDHGSKTTGDHGNTQAHD